MADIPVRTFPLPEQPPITSKPLPPPNSRNVLSNLTSADIKYDVEQQYVAIPGTSVRIILEFPQYSKDGKSAIIVMDDAMTISYSIYRAKPTVLTLGQHSLKGYGLGARTVAGSLIRSVFTTDNVTEFQTKCYLADQEEIKARLMRSDNSIPTGLPLKDNLAFMKDDLSYFNIHICSISEQSRITADMIAGNREDAYTRFETIYGAIIMNTGQVYSIEDLITESTFSFQAKAVRSTSKPEAYGRGYSTSTTVNTVSNLLGDN